MPSPPRVDKKDKETLRFSLLEESPQQQDSTVQTVYGCLLAALLFAGVGCSLYCMAPPSFEIPLLVTGLVVAVVMYLCWIRPRIRIVGSIVLFVILAGFTAALFADVADGLNLTANHISGLWGAQTGRIQPLLQITVGEESYTLVATLFLIPVSAVLAYLCSYLVYRMQALVSLCLAILILFAAWLLNTYPPVWALILLLLSQVLMVAGRYVARSWFVGRSSPAQMVVQGSAALLAAVMLVAVGLLLPQDYQVPEPVRYAQKALTTAIDNARYGVNTSLGMPDGDFSQLGNLELSGDTALEVSMENPESLWLRGYVGSEYTGAGWEQTSSKTLYESESLFYWLHSDAFYGQSQLAAIALLLDTSVSDTIAAVTVNNVGASSRNIYAPYEMYWAEEELLPQNGIGDAALYSEGFFGNRSYDYLTVANQVKRYPDISNLLAVEEEKDNLFLGPYLLDESYYLEFAEEHYLSMSDEMSSFLDDCFAPYLMQNEEASYTTYKQAIISCLTENVTYSATPWTASTADDFILSFLSNTKEGYSVHYASAATMMFRYCGVPARYVEGYLITPGDVEGLEESATIKLDGTHAHAWVEIYINGIGWVPVEVTPPYFGLMEEPESYEGVPGAQSEEEEEEDTSDSEGEFSEDPSSEDLSNREMLIPVWTLVLIGFLLLVLAFIIWWLVRRRRIIATREAGFAVADNAKAIIAMYTYALALLQARGLPKDRVWLVEHVYNMLSTLQTDYLASFPEAFALYEEAAYSGVAVSNDKRGRMQWYKDGVLAETRQKCSFFRRFKIRWVQCLY